MGKDLKGKELGQGISQRKDGVYCARYTNRFGKRKSIYDKKLVNLKDKLRKAEYEDKVLNLGIKSDLCLDKWFEIWITILKHDTRETTKSIYTDHYKSFISPDFGTTKLTSLTQIDVSNLINKLADNNYAWSTQDKVKRILSDMYNKAIANNYAKTNPTRGVKIMKHEKDFERRTAFTKEEQLNFIEISKNSFYHNAFLVQLNTGMRPGELFALTYDDIDFNKKTININKTLQFKCFDGKGKFLIGNTKTPSSKRIIPMNSSCMKALKQQIEIKKMLNEKYPGTLAKDFLFTTNRNRWLNTSCYNAALKTVLRKMELEDQRIKRISAHSLRHSFATRCFERDISAKVTQEILGHSSVKTTMDIYTHVTDGQKAKLIENIDMV